MRCAPVLWLGLAACLDPSDPGNLVPKTVVEDESLPAIEVNGARFHSEAFGPAGAPMVMVLHGGPGSDYRGLLPLAKLAEEGKRVVFWDQRGAGLSQRFDAKDLAFDPYLEDLRLVIEHYTVSADQPIVFIGHSWGAMYATWFIDTYGDYGGRVRGAVLSEPGAFTNTQLEEFLDLQAESIDFFAEDLGDIAWQEQFMSSADHERADYVDSLKLLVGQPSEHRDPANPRPFWRSGTVVRNRLIALGRDLGFDWTRNLDAFQRPVLFLRGDLNTGAPLEQQQAYAASYPQHEVITLEGVGHQMIWERPEDYLREVRSYFTTIAFGVAP